jgi:hypothetical protein
MNQLLLHIINLSSRARNVNWIRMCNIALHLIPELISLLEMWFVGVCNSYGAACNAKVSCTCISVYASRYATFVSVRLLIN